MSIAITFRNISLSLLLLITEAVGTLQNAFFSSSLSMSNLGIRDIVSFVCPMWDISSVRIGSEPDSNTVELGSDLLKIFRCVGFDTRNSWNSR